MSGKRSGSEGITRREKRRVILCFADDGSTRGGDKKKRRGNGSVVDQVVYCLGSDESNQTYPTPPYTGCKPNI